MPEDLYFKNENFSFYLPITTCILISIFISFLFWLVNKF
ncbi:DUF2905 domain-containing protein [Silvanigrella aquatica]